MSWLPYNALYCFASYSSFVFRSYLHIITKTGVLQLRDTAPSRSVSVTSNGYHHHGFRAAPR